MLLGHTITFTFTFISYSRVLENTVVLTVFQKINCVMSDCAFDTNFSLAFKDYQPKCNTEYASMKDCFYSVFTTIQLVSFGRVAPFILLNDAF